MTYRPKQRPRGDLQKVVLSGKKESRCKQSVTFCVISFTSQFENDNGMDSEERTVVAEEGDTR
jgi:hypothetical protein